MVPIARAGSATAFRADVGGAEASPLGTELFASMTPGDRGRFVWLSSSEPAGLDCADESDPASLLVCSQLSEGLYASTPGGVSPIPSLAQRCAPNAELTVWTCSLRANVVFHDGAALDANDVVSSFAAQWDASNPLHRGRQGTFAAFVERFGGLLNAPAVPTR
jgi:peptide/nickel transport system substrate-binding protein